MFSPQHDDIRGAITRHLETDILLGVKYVPLSPPRRIADDRKSAPHISQITSQEVANRTEALEALDEQQVKVCTKCGLYKTRTQTVFGQGHAAARLVFVGEAPGAEEDRQGLAFVGRAGQLLTKMVEAMGLTREEVFICNILKCRPPNNRDPAPDEVSCCRSYLDKQMEIIQPEVIVALGKPAAQTLLNTKVGITQLRGKWHEYHISGSPLIGKPTPLMPTFHPAYLLRNPAEKAKAWSDLKEVMTKLGLPIPEQHK
ncbi:MAG: uracil-DNA glycosylase [Planctomycetota bacterium]|nr:MAG: uracil-DNA glycosylase [Planctomycetota bacterium]